MTRRTFLILSALVVLLAFGVREWFVLTMTVPEPISGDSVAYVRYALHLAWDGVFSSAGNGQPALPDAFRSPGYPWLLWALAPGDDSVPLLAWFARVYQAQVLLGAATVGCVIALARLWMRPAFALMAGVWMALQPHHVAGTGALLTEIMFGALIVGGLLAASHAYLRRSVRLGLLAGAILGLGYLTNPVIAFLPFLLLPMFWKRARHPGLVMCVLMLVAIGGWVGRNAAVDARGDDRAAINFVQGSWPGYHDMWKWPWRWPAKKARMDHEVATITADRDAGLRLVSERLQEEPAGYAGWYLSKPWYLFDWEVKVGHGMAYVVTMKDTALDEGPLLMTTTLQWVLNPLLFCMAFCGLALSIRGGPQAFVAVAVVYLTAVHVVLQAEPRYAIPYRSLEILLAFGALSYLFVPLRITQPGPQPVPLPETS